MKKGDKYNVFLKWLNDNGAVGESLYFKKYTNTMRGVVSQKPIPTKTVVMKIPLKLLVHSNIPKNKSDIVKKLIDFDVVFFSEKHVYLSIYIAETISDPGHFFQPYYSMLPENLDNIPLFWDNEEMELLLAGSNIISDIKKKQRDITVEYKSIIRYVPSFKAISSKKIETSKALFNSEGIVNT